MFAFRMQWCAFLFKGVSVISHEVINQTVKEEGSVLITCEGSGKPIPSISWYFNGAPVEEVNTIKYKISETLLNPITKISTLAVMSLTLSDMGTYTCNAVNQVSSDSGSGVVTVNSKCQFTNYIKIKLNH